jgi:hypothetical protein
MERSTALNKNLKTSYHNSLREAAARRQRGHHAIALSERTLFDEPGLFEHYFLFG